MSQVSQLSPELARGLLHMARALLVAARNWTLYPPEHPAVGASVERLARRDPRVDARRRVRDRRHARHADDRRRRRPTRPDRHRRGRRAAARSRHPAHHVRRRRAAGRRSTRFLRLLTLDAGERRRRGGPARIWAADGHRVDRHRADRLREGAGARGRRRRRAGQARRPLALDRHVDRRRAEGGLRRARAGAPARDLRQRRATSAISPTAVAAPKCTRRRLADDHVAGGHRPRRLPSPDQHRLGDVARSHARGDEQPGDRRDAARSARDHAGDAERRTTRPRRAGRRRHGGGVRRRQGRAAAGDGAGARRPAPRIGSRRSSTRSRPTRTASGAS